MGFLIWLGERIGADRTARRGQQRVRNVRSRPAPRYRPWLEALEDRCVPSTFAVTNADDNANEKGTLRFAVDHAESGDTILLTGAVKGGIVLTQGELALNQNVTITSAGNHQIMISGGGSSRVFEVAANANVTLSDLVITGGNGVANSSNSTGFDGDGGGILNFGTLRLTNCALSGNSASLGGGIANGGLRQDFSLDTSAKLTLNNCTLSDNAADILGGGLDNFANLSISGSTLRDNTAAFEGGGIYNVISGTLAITTSILRDNAARNAGALENHGAATITSTLLSGNHATDIHGGAIWNEASATLTVTGCTLSGNSAPLLGGGIDNEDGATLTIGSSLLSGNSAVNGGGVFNGSTATLTVLDSIFSGNSASQVGGGIDNVSASATVADSVFSKNTPVNIAGGFIDGGGNTL